MRNGFFFVLLFCFHPFSLAAYALKLGHRDAFAYQLSRDVGLCSSALCLFHDEAQHLVVGHALGFHAGAKEGGKD